MDEEASTPIEAIEPTTGMRTLRLKVKSEAYPWLNAAAIEVNQVWNYCNATSDKAARPFAGPRRWLSGFDLDKLTAGASHCFERIGSDTIQRITAEFSIRRQQFKKTKLRWRKSFGSNRDLGLKTTVATSDGESLEAGRFYRCIEEKIAQAQRRGHRHQAKRLHRRAARRRRDALHKLSRHVVDRYQLIAVGDVSSQKLVRTKMAKSVLDAGWGLLKAQLLYKGQWASRRVIIVSERYTTQSCSNCRARTGPAGLDGLAVRTWICVKCGVTHDRDVNAGKNILFAARCSPSLSGNESLPSTAPPSQAPAIAERAADLILGKIH